MKLKLILGALAALLISVAYGTSGYDGHTHNGLQTLNNGEPNKIAIKAYIGADRGIDVRDYATSGSGTSGDPWVGALAGAFAVHGGTASYHLPAGYYEDQTTTELFWDTSDGYITISGDGEGTRVRYDAADGTPCWDFNTVDSSVIYWMEIRDIYFDGESAATGSMIRMYDVDKVLIENVHVNNHKAANTSTGMEIHGRECVWIKNCNFHAKIGILIGENPNHSIDFDSFHIEDCMFLPADSTNGYGVKITGDFGYNLNIDHCNMVRCRYGVYWDGTSADGTEGSDGDPLLFHIQHCKFEQGEGTSAWGIYFLGLAGTDNSRNIQISNCQFGTDLNGIYLDDVTDVSVDNCLITAGNTYTAIDCDDAGYSTFTVRDSYLNPSATLTINTSSNPVFQAGDIATGFHALTIWSTNGRVRLGGTGADTFADSLQIIKDEVLASLGIASYHTTATVSPTFDTYRAYGTQAVPTVIDSGADARTDVVYGYDGDSWETLGKIVWEVDAACGNGDMPGRMSVYTTPDASATPAAVYQIDSAQRFKTYGLFTNLKYAPTITEVVGAGPATLTLTPTSSYVELTNPDTDGCTVTMGEGTPVTEGAVVTIVNVGANACTITDDDAAADLAGDANFVMGQYDSLTLRYIGDRWVEQSRADN